GGARQLRRELPSDRSPVGDVRPARLARGQARRSSGRADRPLPSRAEPQDRQGHRRDDSQGRARSGGRDRPVSRRLAALLATILAVLALGDAYAQAPVHRVGVVLFGGPYSQAIDGLRDGLRELGMEEGRQYAFLVRDAKGDLEAAGEAAKGLEAEK